MKLPIPRAFACILVAGLAIGCKDKAQKSAEGAAENLPRVVELTAKDVEEVERGLPEGAKKLSALLPQDAEFKNGPFVKTALHRVRQQVADLGVAKSTFFALADEKGICVRNDLEQDVMAGKDIAAGWPGLKPALAGQDFVATNGRFPGAPNPAGPDKEWVAAVPMKRDGAVVGMFVTGWTYRRYAFHLQENLKRDLQDQLMRTNESGKLPILYVAIFDREGVYGATAGGSPPFPPVNEQTLAGLDLVGKTAGGPASAPIVITDRPFGWAAARTPKLGNEVGVVILRSEI